MILNWIEMMLDVPTTSNLLPDLASTQLPLTYDLSWNKAGFLTWFGQLVSFY